MIFCVELDLQVPFQLYCVGLHNLPFVTELGNIFRFIPLNVISQFNLEYKIYNLDSSNFQKNIFGSSLRSCSAHKNMSRL